MAATVGPRAAQSAHLLFPSRFRASLTARVLRSIVSWEGIASCFFCGRLAGVFGLALLLTGALASPCARECGCAAGTCASVSGDPTVGCVKPRPQLFFLWSASVLQHARFSYCQPRRLTNERVPAVPDGLERLIAAQRQPTATSSSRTHVYFKLEVPASPRSRTP